VSNFGESMRPEFCAPFGTPRTNYCQTFTSAVPPQRIVNNFVTYKPQTSCSADLTKYTVESFLEVPTQVPVESTQMVVRIQLTHDYFGDLQNISLTSPSGTTAVLTDLSQGSGCMVKSVGKTLTFSLKEGASAFDCSADGTYNGVFSPFDGESSRGLWILSVTDVYSDDGGILSSFEMDICTNKNDVSTSGRPNDVKACSQRSCPGGCNVNCRTVPLQYSFPNCNGDYMEDCRDNFGAGDLVSDDCCDLTDRPALDPCESFAMWSDDITQSCNAPCGGGTSIINVGCYTHGIVGGQSCLSTVCSRLNGPMPPSTVPCNQHECLTYAYEMSPFEPCSRECGSGTRTREASCRGSNSTYSESVSLSLCTGTVPPVTEPCNTAPCPDSPLGVTSPHPADRFSQNDQFTVAWTGGQAFGTIGVVLRPSGGGASIQLAASVPVGDANATVTIPPMATGKYVLECASHAFSPSNNTAQVPLYITGQVAYDVAFEFSQAGSGERLHIEVIGEHGVVAVNVTAPSGPTPFTVAVTAEDIGPALGLRVSGAAGTWQPTAASVSFSHSAYCATPPCVSKFPMEGFTTDGMKLERGTCSRATKCSTCLASVGCGWCDSRSVCLPSLMQSAATPADCPVGQFVASDVVTIPNVTKCLASEGTTTGSGGATTTSGATTTGRVMSTSGAISTTAVSTSGGLSSTAGGLTTAPGGLTTAPGGVTTAPGGGGSTTDSPVLPTVNGAPQRDPDLVGFFFVVCATVMLIGF
jgi:subtilisin-like proprotein convertase family protein